MDVQQLTEEVKAQTGLMVEKVDELTPVMFVISDEKLDLVSIELTEQTKQNWQLIIPDMLREFRADAYIQVMEAWHSIKLSLDSNLTKRLMAGEITVSQLPPDDREEVVQVLVIENRKSVVCWTAKIRHKGDRRFITSWESMPDGVKFEGRLIVTEW